MSAMVNCCPILQHHHTVSHSLSGSAPQQMLVATVCVSSFRRKKDFNLSLKLVILQRYSKYQKVLLRAKLLMHFQVHS